MWPYCTYFFWPKEVSGCRSHWYYFLYLQRTQPAAILHDTRRVLSSKHKDSCRWILEHSMSMVWLKRLIHHTRCWALCKVVPAQLSWKVSLQGQKKEQRSSLLRWDFWTFHGRWRPLGRISLTLKVLVSAARSPWWWVHITSWKIHEFLYNSIPSVNGEWLTWL